MANFPAGIRCSSLALVAGIFPGVSHRSVNGNAVEVQHGNRATGARIRVMFQTITRDQLHTIKAHYEGEGTVKGWLLSSELLDGAEFASEIATMKWRYVAPPNAVDISLNTHNLDFELEHVPATVWVDSFVLKAPPLIIEVAGTPRLLGPDVIPSLWVSRLTTAGGTSQWPGRANGTMAIGNNGDNFQVFWFGAVGETGFRVVVLKRSNTGAILWQRWSSSPIGGGVTARDSYGPAVLALPDGGCVVAAQNFTGWADTGAPAPQTMLVWRLAPDGGTTGGWSTTLTTACTGPLGMVLNGGEVIIGTESTHKDIAPTTGFNFRGPAIIRLRLTDGQYQGAQVYKIGGDNNESYLFRHMRVLAGGDIVLSAARYNYTAGIPNSYLTQVSPDGSIVFGSYGYAVAGGNRDMAGPFAVLPDGGYLVSPRRSGGEELGFLRLNASMQVQNHYIPKRASGFDLPYNTARPMALDVAADGVGYLLQDSLYLTPGVGALCINSNGSGFSTYSDVGIGSGIGEIPPPGDGVRHWQALDIANRRAVTHIANGNGNATCRVTAIGFDLLQTLGTGPNTTPAATIDTQTCGNTMEVRGFDPAEGSVDIGPLIARSTMTTPTGTFSVTQSAGTVSMVDASTLQWQRVFYIS